MDDDKLKRLKRDREVRRRGRSVEETWSRIDRDDGASVKDKLQKLIQLTGAARKKPSRPGAAEEARSGEPFPDDIPGDEAIRGSRLSRSGASHARASRRPDAPFAFEAGDIEPAPREPLRIFEASYPLDDRYGKFRIGDGLKISGEILTTLSRDEEFLGLDLSTALFIDLETTGLAGGTGTVPFLVGMGFFRGDRFVVTQYFLGELGEEERMIGDLARFFEEGGFRSVVTYNGKAFDVPLLETRFVLARRVYRLSDLPHLDFLFSARHLWKHKHESCRLFHLAREVVNAGRTEDIPSAEIPYRYFDYLRTGNFDLIEPILYHNVEDILSLLGLVVAGAELFAGHASPGREDEGALPDPLDLFGVARILESVGDTERSVALFERALGGGLPSVVEASLKRKLSLHFKRSAEWEKAVSLWKDLSSDDQLFCFRELAVYYEHRTRNFAEALRISEEGLTLAVRVSDPFESDFRRRIERLNAKMKKAAAADNAPPRKKRA